MASISNKLIIVLFLGIINAFSVAPFYILTSLFITLSAFFYIINNTQNHKNIPRLFFSFGMGFNFAFLHWLIHRCLYEDSYIKIIIMILLLIILNAVYAVIYYLLGLLYKYFKSSNNYNAILFANLMLIGDIIRTDNMPLHMGVPWNLWGYAINDYPKLILINKFIGIYGVTFLVIIIAIIPAVIYIKNYKKLTYIIILSVISIDLININNGEKMFISSIYNKNNTQAEKMITHENATIRLIQSNIPESNGWDFLNSKLTLDAHLKYSILQDNSTIKYLFWPESAIRYGIIDSNSAIVDTLITAVPKNGYLFSGILRYEIHEENNNKLFNSMMLLSEKKELDFYDKVTLVPLGEFNPIYIEFIFNIFNINNDINISKGKGYNALKVKEGIKYMPIICFESIFQNKVISAIRENNFDIDYLVNSSNDCWLGSFVAPYQSFEIARVRAIETGIPVLRVANVGITAAIDINGNYNNFITLGEKGYIDIPPMTKKHSFFLKNYKILNYIGISLVLSVFIFSNKAFIIFKKLLKYLIALKENIKNIT